MVMVASVEKRLRVQYEGTGGENLLKLVLSIGTSTSTDTTKYNTLV